MKNDKIEIEEGAQELEFPIEHKVYYWQQTVFVFAIFACLFVASVWLLVSFPESQGDYETWFLLVLSIFGMIAAAHRAKTRLRKIVVGLKKITLYYPEREEVIKTEEFEVFLIRFRWRLFWAVYRLEFFLPGGGKEKISFDFRKSTSKALFFYLKNLDAKWKGII
jgi:hypothetical protein